MRQREAFLLLAVGSVLSCTDTTGPGETSSGAPRRELVDGRNGGAPDFYFLPPLAPNVSYASAFDGTRSPIVEICPLSQAGQCGAVVARFTMTAGKGLDYTRIEVKGQHYVVKWKTKQSDLSLNQTYRIRVLEGSSELGHVDTRMVKKDKDSRSLPAGVVGVVLGSTLPIKFRLSATGGGPAVRLEIHPGTFLLTGAGQEQFLEVSAFDAQGQPTGGQVVWHSSNEAVMTVSGDGVAQAVAGSGSTQVTAQIGTATSAPALGIVTQPAVGALLISDDDVVGATTVAGSGGVAAAGIVPIVPVDPNASYALGWQYRVRLSGVNPTVGQILLTTGELPVGGRVVSVTPDGNEIEVTLALVTIAEMFPTLSINESISLHESEMALSSSISPNYSATRQSSGRVDFERRNFSSFGSGGLRNTVLNPVGPRLTDIELEIGPFDCKISGAVGTSVTPSLGNLSYHVDPDLTLDLVFTPSNGLEKLIVRGGIEGGITFSPLFPLAMEEKIECKVQLATIVLPIGGPLSLLVGGQIPIGVGFELGGKLSIGNVGYDASMTAGANMSLGIDCTAGCKPVSELNGSATGSFKPIIPSSADGRGELSATGFAWAELAIGNSFFNALQFKAFEAKAGLKQNFLIASPTAQVADAAYASSFKFSFDVEAGTGSSLSAVAGLLNINLSTLKLENSTPLAESPRKVSFTISPATVRAQTLTDPGEKANFILTLDPVTYFGAYAVDSVELYRKKTTGPGTFVLEQVPGGCGQIAPTNGQSAFSCETALPNSWGGSQTVYAFVKAKIFGAAVPVLLELAEDAKATVTVDTARVTVTPSSVSLSAGGTQQFTATVSGLSNTAVTWSATGGTISSSGLFTAGSSAGQGSVTATSVAAPAVSGSAQVTVVTATQKVTLGFYQLAACAVNSFFSCTNDLLSANAGSQQFSGTVSKSATILCCTNSSTATGSFSVVAGSQLGEFTITENTSTASGNHGVANVDGNWTIDVVDTGVKWDFTASCSVSVTGIGQVSVGWKLVNTGAGSSPIVMENACTRDTNRPQNDRTSNTVQLTGTLAPGQYLLAVNSGGGGFSDSDPGRASSVTENFVLKITR